METAEEYRHPGAGESGPVGYFSAIALSLRSQRGGTMRRYMWSLAAFGVLVSALMAEANQGGGSALQGRVVDA